MVLSVGLRDFMSRIDRGAFQLAWEPRGNWEDQQVFDLCQELDLTHAVDPFLRRPVWGETNYFRLHGGPDYSHQYQEGELKWLIDQLQDPKLTYCLFNNVSMWEDGLKMKELLKGIK